MSSEKTEDPTPRRQRKARESGDIPVSGALTQTAALLPAVLLLPTAIAAAWNAFVAALGAAVQGTPTSPWQLAQLVCLPSLPLLACAAFGAIAVGVLQTGAAFAPKRLVPKLSSLDPVEGLKKLFSLEKCVQVLRSLATALLLAWICGEYISHHLSSLVASTGRAESAAFWAGVLARRLLWFALAISAVSAAIDVLLVRRSWFKRNRMSKEEVQREYRESEGDPQIKQERRRAHQEMLDNASVLALRDASVLIVNPTHLATALRYDREHDEAPKVVAQGEGHVAARLIAAAHQYGIPVVRDIPVARALRELAVGDEIPEELYEAVAEILREVWAQSHPEAGDE